jgi:DnaJ-class molecular chaperone
MKVTEEMLKSMEQWAACDLREREGSEVQALIDEIRRLRCPTCPQCGGCGEMTSTTLSAKADVQCSRCWGTGVAR